MKIFWLFTVIAITFYSCNNSTAPEEINYPQAPDLNDSIPYNAIGIGKLVFERIGPTTNNYNGIYILDALNKKSIKFTQPAFGVAIAPDGMTMAYAAYSNYTTAYDIYVNDIYGTSPKKISSMEGQELSPSWSDDGKIIFYSQLFNSFSVPLFIQSPVPNAQDKIQLFDFSKAANKINPVGPVFKSNSGKFVFTNGKSIVVFSSGDSNNTIIYNDTASNKFVFSPAFSPVTNRIAFGKYTLDSSGYREKFELFSFLADGTDLSLIIQLPAKGNTLWNGPNNYAVCWSPDGNKLAFTLADGQFLESHIYIVNKDGTGLTKITSAAGVFDRSISWK